MAKEIIMKSLESEETPTRRRSKAHTESLRRNIIRI